MTDSVNPLPEPAIRAILDRYGEAMLLGAHARDYVATTKADYTEGRRTTDLDLAIAAPSITDFKKMTRPLGDSGGTGMRFDVEKVKVDLIPLVDAPGVDPVIEVVEGIQMDTTGIDEAFQTAEHMEAPFEQLRIPTLHAMIVLKTVAWRMRRAATNKDAEDLALLFKCTDQGDYADRCYEDDGILERFDADSRRIGAYLTGADARRDLPRATLDCLGEWSNPELAEAMEPRYSSKGFIESLAQRLSDFAAGAREYP